MSESEYVYERFVMDENHEPIGRTPILNISTPLGVVDMDYENTVIRTFGEGFLDMNHIQYTDEEGDTHGIFFESFDTSDILALHENNFPMTFDPIPNEDDREWYDDIMLKTFKAKMPDVEGDIPPTSPHIAVKLVRFALHQVTDAAGKFGIKI